MKNVFVLLFMIAGISSFSQISFFEAKTNEKIIQELRAAKMPVEFAGEPLFVVDGNPISNENRGIYSQLKPENITLVNLMDKRIGAGEAIWGVKAHEGVIFINTDLIPYPTMPGFDQLKTIYVLGNKVVDMEEAFKMENLIGNVVAGYANPNKFLLPDGTKIDMIMVVQPQ